MIKFSKKIFIALTIAVLLILGSVVFVGGDFLLEKTGLRKIAEVMETQLAVFAQELTPYASYFFPRYPQRLMFLAMEISEAGQELVASNERLTQLVEQCDCRFAQSECLVGGKTCEPGTRKTYGDPCPGREKIGEEQSQILEKQEQISYLRNLLEAEMAKGLERELESLRPEEAEELRNNLNKIIAKSDEIYQPARKNWDLPHFSCSTEGKCAPNCKLGHISEIKACLFKGSEKQDPIELKFKAGVKLDKWSLGQIKISNLNLGLPKEIQLPKIEDLTVTIPGQEVVINFPQKKIAEIKADQRINISLPPVAVSSQLSLPTAPKINSSCPQFPVSSYQCGAANQAGEVEIPDYNWFSQTYEFLSDHCQDFPTMKENWGILKEKAGDCLNPEKVVPLILKECPGFWYDYCNPPSEIPTTPPPPPKICKDIKYDCGKDGEMAAADRCKELFDQEKEPLPSSCKYYFDEEGDVVFSKDFNPVATLKNKCQELKEKGKKEVPEPCKILPLFTGLIETPKSWEGKAATGECSAQKVNSFPGSLPWCPAAAPTIPKLSFPQIVIPDIKMGTIRIGPFVTIKLPSFIFEDLVIPDIELCNLDDCKDFFPFLKLKTPGFRVPSVSQTKTPPEIEVMFQNTPIKIPMPDIATNIEFPSIVFPMPQLSQLRISSLTAPKMEIPKISLPKPKIYFSFSGIDLSGIFGLIASFIEHALGIPDFSVCLSVSLPLPLTITFPDYYFSWPAFPKIPEIPFCKNIREFCQKAKTSIKEVVGAKTKIENVFNKTFEEKIQAKLDNLKELLNIELAKKINDTFDEYYQKIKTAIEDSARYAQIGDDGLLKIQPVVVSLPEKKFVFHLDAMAGLPDKIDIPWPAELKEINLSQPLTYDLPEIPLDKLSYEKEIILKGPGFSQSKIGSLISGGWSDVNLGECIAEPPGGGNPCAVSEFQNNLDTIKALQTEINETSKKIRDILE